MKCDSEIYRLYKENKLVRVETFDGRIITGEPDSSTDWVGPNEDEEGFTIKTWNPKTNDFDWYNVAYSEMKDVSEYIEE